MSLLDTASLLLTPNAYKEGKLYSVIPSDGSGDFTFTRATTATRVNSDGLVELVPYNLLQYSNAFSNAAWVKTATTITSGQADPNGGTSAFKLVENTSTSFHRISIGYTMNLGSAYTISVTAKASGRNLTLSNNVASGSTIFDLTNGVIVLQDANVTSASITSIGGGWYRCQMTSVGDATGAKNAFIGLDDDNVFNAYTGNGVSGVFIYQAQLVEGTNALDYQRTETRLNIPRLDYSLGGCPNILLEPQRTNLFQRSEEFNDAYWTKTASSITANATTSPSGVLNAEKLIENSATASHLVERTQTGITNGTVYTLTSYLKKAEREFGFVGVFTGESKQLFVNLTTGAITSSVGTWVSTSVQSLVDGWFRVSVTFTAASTTIYPFFGISNNGTSLSYLGNGTSGIYLWGAQLEVGSYATSYIPTTTASVTRNNDSCVKTSATALIGQTEGTLFAEIEVSKLIGIASRYIFHISDGTVNNRIYMAFSGSSSNVLRGRIFNGGTLQCSIDTSTITSTGTYKLALAYKNNDIVFYVNGVQIGVNTSATIPTCSRVDVGQNYANTSQFSDGIKASVLWKTRLTNNQLAQLTTL